MMKTSRISSFHRFNHLAELLLEHGCEMDYRVITCPREGQVMHVADARRPGGGMVVVYGSGDSYDAAIADLYRGMLAYHAQHRQPLGLPWPAWARAVFVGCLLFVAATVGRVLR